MYQVKRWRSRLNSPSAQEETTQRPTTRGRSSVSAKDHPKVTNRRSTAGTSLSKKVCYESEIIAAVYHLQCDLLNIVIQLRVFKLYLVSPSQILLPVSDRVIEC